MMMTVLPVSADIGTAYTVSAAEKLSAPSDLRAARITDTTITLTWNKRNGADAYRVYIYNAESKKYEKYKTVTGTYCTVKDLSPGKKYKFKVAALKKNGTKYSVQKKSSPITAETKDSSAAGAKPKELNAPKFGDSSEKALAGCGIGNYTGEKLSDGKTKYTGTVLLDNMESKLCLTFNKNDQMCEYELCAPMQYLAFTFYLDGYVKSFGEYTVEQSETQGAPTYVWQMGTVTMKVGFYEECEMYVYAVDQAYSD